MAQGDIFQLTAVSQDDRGCPIGAQLTGTVTAYSGGSLRSGSFPVNQPVPLPIPPRGGHKAPPSPTWFLVLDDSIEDASFTIVIEGPGTNNPTTITIDGANMPKWVAQNQKEDTNQIYRAGQCGIFGFAQENQPSDQPVYWIYTVTGGVFHPKVHPPSS
ncbi:MAG TPA: hypothetical protein VFC23_00175 [Thermoanaerobaculia bacterium]|nr:hypothetical protein [Thermoanaerobaculia bacterium]